MSKAPIDPIKIWLSAEAFRRTTDELSRLYNNGKGEVFLIPIWVNQAFALELYFKCLLTLKTPSPPRNTHRFDELFENLPKIEKARVVKYYNQLSKNDQLLAKLPMEAPEFSNELREVLKDGSEVFEKMRYAYEGLPDQCKMRAAFQWPIAALRCVILEVHPSWPPFGLAPTSLAH